ncbi:MAG: IclR family transcriptional regulator [Alphaproteobacteria bacterium]|nr:IclR family transcriptional regulator [Alphaproteobacteria bacterium]
MLKTARDGAGKTPLYEDDGLDEDPKDRQFVTALARGLEVLRCFRPGDVGLGNQEIAERTRLPKPTISRLTHTLTRLGYLKYSDRQGSYQLGAGVLALGYSMLSGLDIRDRARPLMQEMADQANASVALGTRDRLSMVYLECCRGQGAVTLRLDVGSRVPIATTAMGRALLASVPDIERNYLMGLMRDRFPDDFAKLEKGVERAIRDIETRGFCLSLGDWQNDVHAAGVPLLTADRSAVFALNCGAPAFLLSPRKLEEEIGPRMVDIARQLTAR